jgi:hypothetical protein
VTSKAVTCNGRANRTAASLAGEVAKVRVLPAADPRRCSIHSNTVLFGSAHLDNSRCRDNAEVLGRTAFALRRQGSQVRQNAPAFWTPQAPRRGENRHEAIRINPVGRAIFFRCSAGWTALQLQHDIWHTAPASCNEVETCRRRFAVIERVLRHRATRTSPRCFRRLCQSRRVSPFLVLLPFVGILTFAQTQSWR